MRELTITNNLILQDWKFVEFGESDHSISINFRFINDTPTIVFNDFSFGFTLTQNDTLLYSRSYPKEGTKYISTDQSYLESIIIDLIPDTKYALDVWSKENDIKSTGTYVFSTGIPQSPYPSWTWNGTQWVPPKPYPIAVEGEVYSWNEDKLNWEILPTLVDTSGYEVI